MSQKESSLTSEEVKQIAQKDDFHIAPFREDGVTYGIPTWIWSVMLDGDLCVRAYNGINSRWYQAELSQKAGKIEAAGMVKNVNFESVSGSINEKIDDAYRKKYGNSFYLGAMISDPAKLATIRVF